jgi:hypothetical protein
MGSSVGLLDAIFTMWLLLLAVPLLLLLAVLLALFGHGGWHIETRHADPNQT